MPPPEEKIETDMQVITADGKLAGYVLRLVDDEIITHHPHRRIPVTWVRRVTDDVYIGRRAPDLT
jgi:hypothetical protein